MRKLLFIMLAMLVVSGCSHQINFNERYNDANWSSIIIAPFAGENAEVAQIEFEHALAVSNQMTVIPASTVLVKMEELGLADKYKEKPTQTLIELATVLKADGIIMGEVEAYSSTPRSPSAVGRSFASIYVKLVDAKNMSIVLSSQKDSTSVFSGSTSLLKDVSQASIEEIKQGFARL